MRHVSPQKSGRPEHRTRDTAARSIRPPHKGRHSRSVHARGHRSRVHSRVLVRPSRARSQPYPATPSSATSPRARVPVSRAVHRHRPIARDAPKRRPPPGPDRPARDRRRRNFKIGSRFHRARAPRERDERRRRRAIDVPSASREVRGDVSATRDRARHDLESRACARVRRHEPDRALGRCTAPRLAKAGSRDEARLDGAIVEGDGAEMRLRTHKMNGAAVRAA